MLREEIIVMLAALWDPKYEKLLEFEKTSESLSGGFQKRIQS